MASFTLNSHSMFTIHKDLDNDIQRPKYTDQEQFIGLLIGAEEFLLSILAIREIILLPQITYVPNASPLIEGVVNLRGTILPAISMRKMMGMPRPESIKSARVVIAKQDTTTFGLIVDGITHVVSLMPKDIQSQNLPKLGPESEFISALCKQQAKVKGMLDLKKILDRVQTTVFTKESEKTSA